ncbi:MAG: GNAT family N-acetyltransferase [Prevotella sp.]
MKPTIDIRQEETGDRLAVEQLIEEAYLAAEHSDGNEATLVRQLRESRSFIPELSLVATIDDRIVGHILFTRIVIGEATGLALAPLAVAPSYQRKGIGGALIARGHDVARRLGYKVSVVLGSPDYYMRHGYTRADRYGIKAPFPLDEPKYFMVCLLDGDNTDVRGTVTYDDAFGI